MACSAQNSIKSTNLDLDLAGHCWVRRLRVDTAHVATGANLQVTSITPAAAPGILHQVVTRASVKASGQDTVVQVGATAGGQHTAGVALERALVGLDGNRDRACLQGGLQAGRTGDILVAGDATGRNGRGVAALAAAGTCSVWVRALRSNAGALVEGAH